MRTQPHPNAPDPIEGESSADTSRIVIVPGAFIGEYEVVEEIGEGGMGMVYRAVHPVIGKQAAVKVLKSRVASHGDLVKRFVREARSVNAIDHPNIVDIFAFGQLQDGRHYFVMEFLDGDTLEGHFLNKGALTVSEALPIFEQIADAMDAVHAQGFIHRDLKPDNVFVQRARAGREPTIKLLDFGIAKLSTANASGTTQSGMILGTPLYMSPEQCKGASVDARTDVYAFGVLVYRALTGRLPFEAESIPALIYQQLSSTPLPASRFGAPHFVDPILARALEKDRDQRYSSLGDVCRALAAAESDLTKPIAAPTLTLGDEDSAPLPALDPLKSTDRLETESNTQDLPAVEPVPQQAERSEHSQVEIKVPARPGAKHPFEIQKTSTQEIELTAPRYCRGHSAGVTDIRFAPDGQILVSASEDGTARLWDIMGNELAILRHHHDRVTHIAFSPQGHMIASGSVDGSICIWSIFDAQAIRTYRHSGSITDVAFTRAGDTVISTSVDHTVKMCAVTTGEVRILKGHSAPVRSIAVAPIGSLIATASDDRSVRLWDDDSGSRKVLRGHRRAVSDVCFHPDGKRLVSCSADGTVIEWSLEGDRRRVYDGKMGTLRTVAYSPKANFLAAAGGDGVVLLWVNGTLRPTALRGHEKRIRHVSFSPDGAKLASSSTDGTVRLWDVRKRSCELIIQHNGAARATRFSPTGPWMATASASSKIALTPMSARRKRSQRIVRTATMPEDAIDLAAIKPKRTLILVGVLILAIIAAIAALSL